MLSMSLATLGWGAWWATLFLMRFAPSLAPSLPATNAIACVFAGAGFVVALWAVRAKLAWLLVTAVPLFANGSLLCMPLVVEVVRAIRAQEREPGVDEPRERGPRAGDDEPAPPTAR